MTDIDLSKVPKGAQYYSASDDGFYTFYRNIEESTYEIFYCGGTRWVLHVGTPEEHDDCLGNSLRRLPQAMLN